MAFRRGEDPYNKLNIGNDYKDFLRYYEQLKEFDYSSSFDLDSWKEFDTYDDSNKRDLALSEVYSLLEHATSLGHCNVFPIKDSGITDHINAGNNYNILKLIWRSLPQKAIKSLIDADNLIDFIEVNYENEGEGTNISATFYIIASVFDLYCQEFHKTRQTLPIQDFLDLM